MTVSGTEEVQLKLKQSRVPPVIINDMVLSIVLGTWCQETSLSVASLKSSFLPSLKGNNNHYPRGPL